MKKIELEQWEPFPGDPRRMQYAGQRVAQEVFEELKHRLESMGYLPDEYFLMDREWENGREIPKDADIFCTTDYGGNEGVYLDVYLKWYEDSRPVTKSFITGKTLGETGADLDRMFLISSAITKAFHGDGETYARHLRQGERAEPEGMIVHLNPTEQRTIIEALVEQQERQEQAMSQTEQLLRRMTGSITAYMDEVGRYPLHISDYDKTVLAIRDGEFDAFKNLYPRVSDQTDDLLIEVAGRPGVVGGNMTLILLAAVERFSPEAYLTACKRAVETGDSWRVQTLVKESEGRLSEPLPSLHGEVILYAYTNNCRNIAKDLIAQCTPEQIASVPPKLLRWVAEKLDFQTAVDLVDKGVRPGDEVAGILRTLTGQHQEWMAERLLEHGMPVEPDNYDALYACVSNQAVGAAKLLLDRGIDLEQYQLWAEHRPKGDGYTETMEELAAYWSELQNSTLHRQDGVVQKLFTYPLGKEERALLRKQMEADYLGRTGKTLNDYYAQLDMEREAPPELTAGTKRLPVDAVSFTDEITECDGKLNFYIPINFDPDAVFGTNVASAFNDDWLNVYANFGWKTGRIDSALTVCLVCSDGHEFEFFYPLTSAEQVQLWNQMDAYCHQQNGQSLGETRTALLREQAEEGLEIRL